MIRFKLKQAISEKEFTEGKRLSTLRLSQETGINRGTLSKMVVQKGEVVVQTDVLDKLCDYFGCDVQDLVEHIKKKD